MARTVGGTGLSSRSDGREVGRRQGAPRPAGGRRLRRIAAAVPPPRPPGAASGPMLAPALASSTAYRFRWFSSRRYFWASTSFGPSAPSQTTAASFRSLPPTVDVVFGRQIEPVAGELDAIDGESLLPAGILRET